MSAPAHAVSLISQYLDTAEYILFRVTLFALFVLGLYRLFRGECKKE